MFIAAVGMSVRAPSERYQSRDAPTELWRNNDAVSINIWLLRSRVQGLLNDAHSSINLSGTSEGVSIWAE
jgi:hypothetical protein